MPQSLKDIMSDSVITIKEITNREEAAELMSQYNIVHPSCK